MNRLIFLLFGKWLKLGEVVKLHASNRSFPDSVRVDDDSAEFTHRKDFWKRYQNSEAIAWLKEHDCKYEFGYENEWHKGSSFDWFQHPILYIKLTAIRFRNDEDALMFKLTYL